MHLSPDERLAVLARCPVFATLPPERLRLLAEMMNVEQFGAGEHVCVQGEPADELYVVAKGHVSVRARGKADVLVRRLGSGEILGEYGMFGARIRTSTVTADESSTLLALDYVRFRELLYAFPEVALALLEVTVNRLVLLPAERDP